MYDRQITKIVTMNVAIYCKLFMGFPIFLFSPFLLEENSL